MSPASSTRTGRRSLLARLRSATSPAPSAESDRDLGRYLGFSGPIPWLLLAVAVVMTLYVPVFVIGPASLPVPSLIALGLLVVSCTLIALPSATPLPAWRTAVILAVVTFTVVAVAWPQPMRGSPTIESGWQLSPCDLLLFCLALRGRFVCAWAGELIVQLVYAAWSIRHTGAPWVGLGFTYGQALPLAAVTLFAVGLHVTSGRIMAHRAAERDRAEREARASAAFDQLEGDLSEVRELAGPTLTAIAEGQNPDKDSVRSLEAALRDMIRGRALAHEPLVSALRQARERGIDIAVLDDTADAEPTEAISAPLVEWAADQVRKAAGHDMTLRLTQERGKPLVTLTVDGKPESRLRLGGTESSETFG